MKIIKKNNNLKNNKKYNKQKRKNMYPNNRHLKRKLKNLLKKLKVQTQIKFFHMTLIEIKSTKLVFFIWITFSFYSCGNGKQISKLEKSELVFSESLYRLVEKDSFRLLPSINCSSIIFTELVEILQTKQKDSLFIYCYSGFNGDVKYNLDYTQKVSNYIKTCLEEKIQMSIVSIGKGETSDFLIVKDTLIDNVLFLKGEVLVKEKIEILNKKSALYFESLMNRVEFCIK
jgi:hypothetical protein